ncbi:MAG TPA: PAS domain-containing sensor histidine kinase [Alphaproteobacteria bacterium]|nr:PAS domain-containing sensor histidine kinase [Alphaproteobacteria bacterium]
MSPSERKPMANSKTKSAKPIRLPPAEPQPPRIAVGEVSTESQSELLRGLCERLSPAYATDAAGNIVYANPAFAQIARALLDLPAEAQAIDETPPALMRIVEKLYLARRPIETHETIDMAGEKHSFIGRHFPIHDDAGEIVGFGGSFTDVTPLNQAAQRASHMENWLQDVVRSSSDWIWSTDHNLNLTFASPRIAETIGLPPHALKGRYLLTLGEFPATDRESPKELLLRRAPFRQALFVMTDDKDAQRYVQLSGVPVFDDASGKFLGYRGTGADVTRQHKAENAERQTSADLEKALEALRARNTELDLALDDARSAERAKIEFLAMMSHELRTPLNAIIGFSDAATQKLLGPLSDSYVGYFRDIHKAGQHLLGIISDILDTANIETQTLSISVAPVRARELLTEACALVAMRAAERKLNMDAVEMADHWTILADRLRTRQILVNLLNNAVKFTPEGGAIGVETREYADGRLAITVWDTGIGIPPDEQERVFERFYQVKSDAHHKRPEGTGLGLSVSRHLAQLMGGDLTLASTPGKGSRFTLILPLAKPVKIVDGYNLA